MSEKKTTEYILKLVVLGDPAVGKTSLINQYIEHSFKEDYKPTLGYDVFKKEFVLPKDNTKVILTFWDIAGQPVFETLHEIYFDSASGVILVYDVN